MSSSSTPEREAEGPSTGGRRILLVEDDFLLAETYCTLIEGCGFTVMGPAATVRAALRQLEADIPDAALLDVNLSGSTVTPVAERLLALDRPFVFLTGVPDLTSLPEHLRHAGILEKPSTADAVRRAIDGMLGEER